VFAGKWALGQLAVGQKTSVAVVYILATCRDAARERNQRETIERKERRGARGRSGSFTSHPILVTSSFLTAG